VNRRQFLTRALAAVPLVVAPAAVVDLLLPKRTIFLPPRGGWFSGLTIDGVPLYWDNWDRSCELAEITRKAFVPKLVVQLYDTSPLLSRLMANGAAA
jgi:hypothetical protein